MATTADTKPATTRKPAARRAPAAKRATPKPAAPTPASSGHGTAAMFGAAAAGLAAGLVANLGRKVAVQAPTALQGDWLEGLKAEHKMTLALFDLLQATTDKNKLKRSTLLTQIKHALAKHAMSEENAVYPALREIGEVEKADELNHEHGYVKDYLYQLDNLPKDSPVFLQKVAEFRAALEEHIRDEEERVFPALHAKLSEAKNKALTHAANKEGFKLA